MTTPPPDEPDATPSAAASEPAAPPPAPHAVFAPVARPPRAPWVNPERRTQLAAWAIIAALLLIGAGFGIGYGVAGSDDDHHRRPGMMYHHLRPYERGPQGIAPYPHVLRPGKNGLPMPGRPVPSVSTTTVTVTPSPASTS